MTRPTIKISGDTNVFSADQIVGKTLIAKRSVDLKRLPSESAQTIYTAKRGESIGTVYSWIGGNGTPLFWQFLDANGRAYYALHQPGYFDISVLKDQGAITVKEATEIQEAEEKGGVSLSDLNPFGAMDLKKYAGYALIGVGVIAAAALAYRIAAPRPQYGMVRIRGVRKSRRRRK